jgi:hypothetical protein
MKYFSCLKYPVAPTRVDELLTKKPFLTLILYSSLRIFVVPGTGIALQKKLVLQRLGISSQRTLGT